MKNYFAFGTHNPMICINAKRMGQNVWTIVYPDNALDYAYAENNGCGVKNIL